MFEKLQEKLKIRVDLSFKGIRSFLFNTILLISCWFGIWIGFFLIYFIVTILFPGACETNINGVCEVTKLTDIKLSNGMLPLLFVAAPVTYLVYKKAKWLFYLISLPSLLLGIFSLLS